MKVTFPVTVAASAAPTDAAGDAAGAFEPDAAGAPFGCDVVVVVLPPPHATSEPAAKSTANPSTGEPNPSTRAPKHLRTFINVSKQSIMSRGQRATGFRDLAEHAVLHPFRIPPFDRI